MIDHLVPHDNGFSSIDHDYNFNNLILNSFNQSRQSDYYTLDLFNALNFNIRSFISNDNSLLSMLRTLKDDPDVGVLTETWLDDNSNSFFSIPG